MIARKKMSEKEIIRGRLYRLSDSIDGGVDKVRGRKRRSPTVLLLPLRFFFADHPI